MSHPNAWKPQDSLFVELSDETAAHRTPEELDAMVTKIREVANEYGFDLACTGTKASMQAYFTGIDLIVMNATNGSKP